MTAVTRPNIEWRHDDLAADLADHLRGNTDRLVWTDMQLGPAASPRPDVYTLQKSYARFQPLAYEIKISVADFRRDITAGKWQAYLQYAAGVFFAAPAGLLSPADVPPGCGLMVRGPVGWRAMRKPTLAALDTLPRDAWMKLLIDGVDRATAETRVRTCRAHELAQRDRHRLSADVMAAVQDLQGVHARIEHAHQKAEWIIKAARQTADAEAAEAGDRLRELRETRDELCAALGLPPGSRKSAIRRAVEMARQPLVAALDEVSPTLARLQEKIKALTPEVVEDEA